MGSQDETRLNKFLALHLGISRREADLLIEKGSVRINDANATLGGRVSGDDTVFVNDKPVSKNTPLTYLLFNKPVGYVCSRKRQGDSPTIYELLPASYHQLKPVGRLDRDSSGLLLLTNDGDFAHQMTHPKFYKVKIYEVELDMPLEPLHQQMISDHGVALEERGLPLAFVMQRGAYLYSADSRPTRKLDFREAVFLSGKTQRREGARWLETRDGEWLRDERLVRVDAPTSLPAAARAGQSFIQVSIGKQVLLAFQGEKPVYATLVSTGVDGLGDPETTRSTVRGMRRGCWCSASTAARPKTANCN